MGIRWNIASVWLVRMELWSMRAAQSARRYCYKFNQTPQNIIIMFSPIQHQLSFPLATLIQYNTQFYVGHPFNMSKCMLVSPFFCQIYPFVSSPPPSGLECPYNLNIRFCPPLLISYVSEMSQLDKIK